MTEKITIVGASGLVGRELLSLLQNEHTYKNKIHTPSRDALPDLSFAPDEIVFLCTPSSVSITIAKKALDSGAFVIDLSSAHRMDESTPLIVPEINPHLLGNKRRLIASPNCVATLLSLILHPLHQAYEIRRVVVATYQAASGAGKSGIEALEGVSQGPFPYPLKENLFLHESPKNESGYSGEEIKIIQETKKILNAPHIAINAHSVRVPTLRAHSIYANIAFVRYPEKPEGVLQKMKGIEFHPNPSPSIASHKHHVFYGPIRRDSSQTNTLDLWICGDQLLKGAALNAVQILTTLDLLSQTNRISLH